MADEKDPVPQIIVSTDEMNAATQKLDEAEEKLNSQLVNTSNV